MPDNAGNQWDVQPDGSIGDGGNDLYDGGGRMDINGAAYQSMQGQALLDRAANELIFQPVQIAGLNVSRRVQVNTADSYCRFTEVLENPASRPQRVTVHVHWDLGASNMQSQNVDDEKKKSPLGVAIFDGRRGIAMLTAGRGAKVAARWQMVPNSDQVEQFYDVDVPAKGTAVLVHVQTPKQSITDAANFISAAKDKDILAGLPKELRRSVVNFRRAESVVGDIELPRADLLDTVELKSGDQYRGTLRDASFTLKTFHGPVELPVGRVIGMVTTGKYRPTQLFVTPEGEVIGGTLPEGAGLKLELTSGQSLSVPLDAIAKVGCRKRSGEPEDARSDKPMALLRDGQRIAVEAPAGPIPVATLYGTISVKPEWISSLVLYGEEHPVHQVKLRDGTTFSGLVVGDSIDLRLRGAAANDSQSPVRFPLALLTRVQFAPPADEPESGDEPPTLALANGDSLVGTAAGEVELETSFDVLKLNAAEIRSLRQAGGGMKGKSTVAAGGGDVTVTMWDGGTMSGRLRGDGRIAFAPRNGVPVRVPAALIDVYANPEPAPPPQMLVQIKAIVADLNDPEWRKRERATEQLRSLGQNVAGTLRALRPGQPPESQKMIDAILASLAREKAAASKKPGAGGARSNGMDERQFPLLNTRVDAFN